MISKQISPRTVDILMKTSHAFLYNLILLSTSTWDDSRDVSKILYLSKMRQWYMYEESLNNSEMIV